MKVIKFILNGFAIFIILIIGIYLTNRFTDPITFDSEKWKNWTESESDMSLRWHMMNSLRKNHKLKGMTKGEIIELLGEPTQNYGSDFGYDLGPSGRGINYGYLELTFDKNGIVTEYKVGDH